MQKLSQGENVAKLKVSQGENVGKLKMSRGENCLKTAKNTEFVFTLLCSDLWRPLDYRVHLH